MQCKDLYKSFFVAILLCPYLLKKVLIQAIFKKYLYTFDALVNIEFYSNSNAWHYKANKC